MPEPPNLLTLSVVFDTFPRKLLFALFLGTMGQAAQKRKIPLVLVRFVQAVGDFA
jgi:hypothetical protein